MVRLAIFLFISVLASAETSRQAAVIAACETTDMNYRNCMNEPLIQSALPLPQLIERLCFLHNGWGTSDVFSNCIRNAAHASNDPDLIGKVDACFEQHSWSAEYFLAARGQCLHAVLTP